ncbi:NUDIX domain-containing protein [Streptomyces sp. NPDC012486]|uniref:NUDIX domain-containing protein n=1 Tax=Streptomyces TaxID=1883 RepID=UPI003401ADB5
MWSLPDGGRDPQDTTLEHAVRRELAEKAGLALTDLTPFGTKYAIDDAGATVPIAIYAGCWNGDPHDLHLTEGVTLAWFTPRTSTACASRTPPAPSYGAMPPAIQRRRAGPKAFGPTEARASMRREMVG